MVHAQRGGLMRGTDVGFEVVGERMFLLRDHGGYFKMARGLGAVTMLLLLLASSGCSLMKYNPMNFGWFKKEEPPSCNLAEQAEYQKALQAASSVTPQPPRVPVVEAPAPVQEKGKTADDEVLVHRFVIKNTGNGVLKITKVISSCGSSVSRYNQSIPPGKEGVITIRLNPGACDESDVNSAIIVTNDPEKPAVAVKVKGAKGS